MFIAAPINSRIPNSNSLAPPAVAVANGYNSLTLYDDFTSLSTIDVNNTRKPGFNWYVGMGHSDQFPILGPYGVYGPGDIKQSGPSTVTLTNPNQTKNYYGIFSALYNYTAPYAKIVGQEFYDGYYTEARFSYDPQGVVNSSPGQFDPSWAISDFMGFFAQQLNAGMTELDFFEAFPDASGGPLRPLCSVNVWNVGGVGSFVSNVNNIWSMTPDKAMHTYGTLWIPMAKNGGTGIIKRYLDSVEQVANRVTYTSNSNPNFGLLDTQTAGSAMVFYSGWASPITIDYVQVWQ